MMEPRAWRHMMTSSGLGVEMARIVAMVLAGLCLLAVAHAAEAPEFLVGQKWTVKDSGMTIVIGRIEPFPGGKTAISVSVFDVPCPPGAGCVTTVVAHAPFDSATLATSVDKLIAKDATPAQNFDEGYANWKQANGGIFTVPVSKLPELLFRAIAPKAAN
jgi:hypothetical protein